MVYSSKFNHNSSKASSSRIGVPPPYNHQQHSTLRDPNFVENYFKSFRLHLIGTERNQYRMWFPNLSNGFKNARSDVDTAAVNEKAWSEDRHVCQRCKDPDPEACICSIHFGAYEMVKKKRSDAEEPVKYMDNGDCENMSHTITIPVDTDDVDVLHRLAAQLFGHFKIDVKDIRGVGLQVSKLEGADDGKSGSRRLTAGALGPSSNVTLSSAEMGRSEMGVRKMPHLEAAPILRVGPPLKNFIAQSKFDMYLILLVGFLFMVRRLELQGHKIQTLNRDWIGKPVVEQSGKQLKANSAASKSCELTGVIFESKGDMGIFSNMKKPVTVPQEFNFAVDKRIPPPTAVVVLFDNVLLLEHYNTSFLLLLSSLLSICSESHNEKPPLPRRTTPNPFHLHTDIPPKPEPKPCTKPSPFQLGLYSSSRERARALTEVQEFNLHVDNRAVDRAEFDKMKEKEMVHKRYREEAEAAKMMEEKAL
ncbi:hypothetical protein ACS0TY_000172 [Phlomoides rotata]